jgi:hypothetical protein
MKEVHVDSGTAANSIGCFRLILSDATLHLMQTNFILCFWLATIFICDGCAVKHISALYPSVEEGLRPKLVVWCDGTGKFYAQFGSLNESNGNLLIEEHPRISWTFSGDRWLIHSENDVIDFTPMAFVLLHPTHLQIPVTASPVEEREVERVLSDVSSKKILLGDLTNSAIHTAGIWNIRVPLSLIHYDQSNRSYVVIQRMVNFELNASESGLSQIIPKGGARLIDCKP